MCIRSWATQFYTSQWKPYNTAPRTPARTRSWSREWRVSLRNSMCLGVGAFLFPSVSMESVSKSHTHRLLVCEFLFKTTSKLQHRLSASDCFFFVVFFRFYLMKPWVHNLSPTSVILLFVHPSSFFFNFFLRFLFLLIFRCLYPNISLSYLVVFTSFQLFAVLTLCISSTLYFFFHSLVLPLFSCYDPLDRSDQGATECPRNNENEGQLWPTAGDNLLEESLCQVVGH